jgi:hypothetical protein
MVHRRPVELQRSGPRECRSFSITNGIAVRGRAFCKRPWEGWNDEEPNNLGIFFYARTALDGFLEVCDHEVPRSREYLP